MKWKKSSCFTAFKSYLFCRFSKQNNFRFQNVDFIFIFAFIRILIKLIKYRNFNRQIFTSVITIFLLKVKLVYFCDWISKKKLFSETSKRSSRLIYAKYLKAASKRCFNPPPTKVLLSKLGLTQWNLKSFEFKLDDTRFSS